MATEQYHEPPGELSEESRTFARMIASLTEEAEAIEKILKNTLSNDLQ